MRDSLPVQQIFGNHIRQLREEAGLRIEQLSEKSGFSSHRLRAIERGEINLNLGTMLILAMSMDTTLQDFLSSVAPQLAIENSLQFRSFLSPTIARISQSVQQ